MEDEPVTEIVVKNRFDTDAEIRTWMRADFTGTAPTGYRYWNNQYSYSGKGCMQIQSNGGDVEAALNFGVDSKRLYILVEFMMAFPITGSIYFGIEHRDGTNLHANSYQFTISATEYLTFLAANGSFTKIADINIPHFRYDATYDFWAVPYIPVKFIADFYDNRYVAIKFNNFVYKHTDAQYEPADTSYPNSHRCFFVFKNSAKYSMFIDNVAVYRSSDLRELLKWLNL